MEFADKYELLDSVTSGAVETFIANDKTRGERVLVHILHCEPQRPNQPTVQWVLDGFRKVAPEPAGLVLETGKYSGTLYAYLVTKLPEETALRSWVKAYNGHRADTREIPQVVAKAPEKPAPKIESPSSEPATAEFSIKPPERAPGQFTQIFRTFEAPPKPSAPEPPAKPTTFEPPAKPRVPDPQPQTNIPLASTGKFEPSRRSIPSLDHLGNSSGPIPPEAWEPLAASNLREHRDELSKESQKVPAPERSFGSDFGVKGTPTESFSPVVKDRPKPGEFTSFFQGPFRPDVPAELPPVSSTSLSAPIEPRRQSVGDFTQMFGPATTQPEPHSPPGGAAKKNAPGTGFTDLFTLPRTPDAPAPANPAPPLIANEPAPIPVPVYKEPSITPTIPPQHGGPVVPPTQTMPTPAPVTYRPPAPSPLSSNSDGATGAFSVPSSSEPVRYQPAPPSGPSPYTQIISMRNLPRTEEEEAAEKPAADKSTGFPSPVKPKMPKVEKPEAPKFKAPAPPKGVKAPKVDASKMKGIAPKPSILPLVLTLTGLLSAGVLLVLFFLLRH